MAFHPRLNGTPMSSGAEFRTRVFPDYIKRNASSQHRFADSDNPDLPYQCCSDNDWVFISLIPYGKEVIYL